MNLSPVWVAELAANGHEAVHWRDVGATDAPDEEIFRWAARNDRIVLTADCDFGAIAVALGSSAASVVQLRTDSTNPARVGPFAMRGIARAGAALRAGAVLTIEPGRTRLRHLPSASSPTDET
jgi:predicted nuclease of predicted toxin-antitoxin system